MKRFYFLFMLLLSILSANAQRVSFQGIVTDTDGKALFGVTVHAAGIEQSVFTDEEGFYRIAGINPGPVKLTFFSRDLKK
jgi:protocatechuate 3,4-dioxygenase beta subunit